MDGTRGHHVKQKKPDWKKQISTCSPSYAQSSH
jgi:hypothetical protein